MEELSIEQRDSAFLDGSIRDMFGDTGKEISAIDGSWEENKLDQGIVEDDSNEDPGGNLEEMLREVMEQDTTPRTHRGSVRHSEQRSVSRQSQRERPQMATGTAAIRTPEMLLEEGNEGKGCQSCSGKEVNSAIMAFCSVF